MEVLKIYLETTIFNFPFVDDSPQYKKDAQDFLAEIKTGKREGYKKIGIYKPREVLDENPCGLP
ncbi:MAG: hypothetical protein LBU17_04625 [Treponema sp.]|jgi:hypothetical protein|nr:hypothetical protein [Treponema sp.]